LDQYAAESSAVNTAGSVSTVAGAMHIKTGGLQKRLGFAFAAAVGLGGMVGAGLMRTSGSVDL